MFVREIMSAPVVTVEPGASLRDAVGRMLDERVGSVVVVDPAPVAILTRSDVMRAEYHTGNSLDALTTADAMSAELVTTAPSATVERAIETMVANNVKKLPVIDGLDLVGIVTLTDVARNQPERVQRVRTSLSRRDGWSR